MAKKVVYNINVQMLESYEKGRRKPIAERTIQTYDNLDDAIDKLIEECIRADYLTDITADEVRSDIELDRELFDKGDPYRIVFKELRTSTYIGPGAYSLEKSVLQ